MEGKEIEMGNKTIHLTEEVYTILVREKRDDENFTGVITRLLKRGKLKDCFGAWDMDDEEEEKIFTNLRKFWEESKLRG